MSQMTLETAAMQPRVEPDLRCYYVQPCSVLSPRSRIRWSAPTSVPQRPHVYHSRCQTKQSMSVPSEAAVGQLRDRLREGEEKREGEGEGEGGRRSGEWDGRG
eukprot:3937620-Rhodomonas_salina.5